MEGWLLVAKIWAWAVVAAGTLVAFAAFAIVISLFFLAFMVVRAECRAKHLNAAPDDPDHLGLRFPPYQGL